MTLGGTLLLTAGVTLVAVVVTFGIAVACPESALRARS